MAQGRRRDRAYDVADTRVTLTIASGGHKGEVLDLRQVTRRDKGKHVHILATSGKDEPSSGTPQVVPAAGRHPLALELAAAQLRGYTLSPTLRRLRRSPR